MADKISGTNASPPDPNMMIPDTSAPKAEAPKAEAPKAETKEEGFFDSMLDGVKARATEYTERLTENIDRVINADGALETFDAAVDLARMTPVAILPSMAVLDDATDALLHLHEQVIEQGKSPISLLGDVSGSAEKVIGRANALVRETLGPDAPQLATHPSKIDIAYTLEMMADPSRKTQLLTVMTAVATEVLIENQPNIKRVLDSNSAEFIGDVARTAGKIVDYTVLAPILGPGAIVVAEMGFRPGTALVEGLADAISLLSEPEKLRDMQRVTSGPAPSTLAALEENQAYETKYKFDIEVAAGKGAKVSAEMSTKATPHPDKDGSLIVEMEIDKELAGLLGVRNPAGVGATVKGGVEGKLTIAVRLPDAEAAARFMQMDPSGKLLHGIQNQLSIEELKLSGGSKINAEVLKDFKIEGAHGGEVDFAKGSVGLETSVEAKANLKFLGDVVNIPAGRDNPEISGLQDVVTEMVRPGGLGGTLTTTARLELDKDGLKYNVEFEGKVSRPSYELEASLKIEVDIGKAAQVMNISVKELQTQLENETLDPATWWQKLPADVITFKPEIKSEVSEGIKVDFEVLEASRAVVTTSEHDPKEALQELRNLEAKDLRTMAGIRA